MPATPFLAVCFPNMKHSYECYTCEVDLDEDEMARFLQDKFYNCPYYQLGDEYRIVRKQM